MLEPFLKPLEISCRKMRKAENQQAQKGTGRNPANSSFRQRVAFLSGSSLRRWPLMPLSCLVSQQPVRCCVVATGSTPRAAASASAAGRALSATCPPRSASTRSAGGVASASWAPAPATRGTKERTAKKVNVPVFAEARACLPKEMIFAVFAQAGACVHVPPPGSNLDLLS